MEVKNPYSAFPQYRVCFVCGTAEQVDVQAEGSPVKVKECLNCGSRMYMLTAVEAYFDRFLGDAALSDDIIDKLGSFGYSPAETPEDPELLSVHTDEVTFDYAIPDTEFLLRFEKTFGVSKRHALKMLRNEAVFLGPKQWDSRVLGTFRPFEEPAGSVIEAMFSRGRLTPEDIKTFDTKTRYSSGVPSVYSDNRQVILTVKEGMKEWLDRVYEAVKGDVAKEIAVMTAACTLETTTSASVDPAFVVTDDDLKNYAALMKDRIDQALGSNVCNIEISDGRLKIESTMEDASDHLVKLGCVFIESLESGEIIVDAKNNFNKASYSTLSQPTATKLSSDLSKGSVKVLAALKKSLNQGIGTFATIDGVKGISISSIFKTLENLEKAGYIEPVVDRWAYRLTAKATTFLGE